MPNDEISIQAPALDGAKNPPLRGVNSGSKAGVTGVNHEKKSRGVLGGTDAVFGQPAGVYGESPNQGVFGHAKDASGTGVYGHTLGKRIDENTVEGAGVRGESEQGAALKGQCFGEGIAVLGIGGRLAGRFEGDVEVTGDIRLANADCAEDFTVACSASVKPGYVMVIGASGLLEPCEEAYCRRVVGVVSGAGSYKPGLILDNQGPRPERKPVALMGKVYCWVDASYGAISAGDMLTTSPTFGHAMLAADAINSFGSVLGKALQSHTEGCALVPLLVCLQ
ncbi:MAG TPA: hypothetical protein VIZ65_06495 [Cellvibrionaceae bacterium]